MSTPELFKMQLRRQLGFLQRSCEDFDKGYHDEAIRIATTIRVLIHNTDSSTSLLNHLNSNSIKLLSTCEDPSPSTFMFSGLGALRFENGTGAFRANLEDTLVNRLLPINDWWNQIVFVNDMTIRLNRRSIVLAAANKDGGAHVDKRLPPSYLEMSKEGGLGYFVYKHDDAEQREPVLDAHLVALRQMGYELLNSKELVRLA